MQAGASEEQGGKAGLRSGRCCRGAVSTCAFLSPERPPPTSPLVMAARPPPGARDLQGRPPPSQSQQVALPGDPLTGGTLSIGRLLPHLLRPPAPPPAQAGPRAPPRAARGHGETPGEVQAGGHARSCGTPAAGWCYSPHRPAQQPPSEASQHPPKWDPRHPSAEEEAEAQRSHGSCSSKHRPVQGPQHTGGIEGRPPPPLAGGSGSVTRSRTPGAHPSPEEPAPAGQAGPQRSHCCSRFAGMWEKSPVSPPRRPLRGELGWPGRGPGSALGSLSCDPKQGVTLPLPDQGEDLPAGARPRQPAAWRRGRGPAPWRFQGCGRRAGAGAGAWHLSRPTASRSGVRPPQSLQNNLISLEEPLAGGQGGAPEEGPTAS